MEQGVFFREIYLESEEIEKMAELSWIRQCKYQNDFFSSLAPKQRFCGKADTTSL